VFRRCSPGQPQGFLHDSVSHGVSPHRNATRADGFPPHGYLLLPQRANRYGCYDN